ncbi:hypothetical protein [Pyrococcus abyssi]|nr:hypothetical protein [Pyrococcus abyssi]
MAKIEYVVRRRSSEYKGTKEDVPFVCAACLICISAILRGK